MTTPFFQTQLFWALPDGKPYTEFQKMWMMFEIDLWIAIAVFILLWFASIQLINLMPKTVQKFVYGSNVCTPKLNMLSLFLNGLQHKVPGRNFARFVLTLLIIWCLIIRTCYQSMLFTFLQSDLREKVHVEDYDDLLKNRTPFRRLNCKGRRCLNIVAEYSNKKFYTLSDVHIADIYTTDYRSGEPSFKTSKKTVQSFFWTHTLPEFSPFIEDFNDMLGRIVASGLGDDWKLYTRQQSFKRRKVEDIGPQTLTLDQLFIGFVACCCFLALAVLAFMLEVFVNSISVSLITSYCADFNEENLLFISYRRVKL